jgi:hypothetical protein
MMALSAHTLEIVLEQMLILGDLAEVEVFWPF